jgi:glutaredoxin
MMPRMTGLRCAIVVVLAAASSAALAQIYRWTDEKGRVHITDTPPPPGAKNVQKRQTPAPSASSTQPQASESYVLQEARKKAPVTLYSTPGCELCGKARALLNERGVPFKEVLITEKQIDELVKAVGANAVPSIAVGSTVQQGFEAGTYHRMLDAAGYPKTGVLLPRAQNEPSPAEPKLQAEPTEQTPRGPYAPGGRRPPQK